MPVSLLQVVSTHSSLMVKGMLSLLTVCPHEVAHLRKELLIAARHILATELRIKFVPHMEKLFDENILLASRHFPKLSSNRGGREVV